MIPSNADNIASWSAMGCEQIAALDPEGDFAKKHLLNPTVLQLVGDVAGRKVLDAGAGQGYFSRAHMSCPCAGNIPSRLTNRYRRTADLLDSASLGVADCVAGDPRSSSEPWRSGVSGPSRWRRMTP